MAKAPLPGLGGPTSSGWTPPGMPDATSKTILDNPFYDDVHAWTLRPRDPWDALQERDWRDMAARYRTSLRAARRIYVEDEMLETLIAASLQIRRIPLWIELARLPFDKVWIEWDRGAWRRALHKMGLRGAPGNERNPRNGFLFERDFAIDGQWHATEFYEPSDADHITVEKFRYVLRPDGDEANPARQSGGMPPIDKAYEGVERMRAAALMGYGVNGTLDAFSVLPWFAHRVSATAEPMSMALYEQNLRLDGRTESLKAKIRAYWGHDLQARIISRASYMSRFITLLAMLNEVPTIATTVAGRTGFLNVARKRVPYADYTTLRIALPKTRQLAAVTRILTAAYGKKRAHEVRGHWRRVSLTSLDPSTDLGPDGRGRKPVVIGEDGVPRIWVNEHIRGDASIGWVAKRYAIQSSDEGKPSKDDVERGGGGKP